MQKACATKLYSPDFLLRARMTYESAFQELQEIVAQLQQGGTGMDELAAKAARAAELIAFCREKLRTTTENTQQLFEAEK